MKIAIHQPYLFPYLGYFQLIGAVDRFVVADNLQYIKNGWINGNRTLFGGGERIISLPVKRDSQYLNINQRFFAEPFAQYKQEFLNKLQNDYRKAPYFKDVFPLLQLIMSFEDRNVASFVTNQLKLLMEYLGIDTTLYISSAFINANGLHCQDWVIAAAKAFSADHYVNSSGGAELYDRAVFETHGIKLSFLKPGDIKYKQFGNDFIENLSIIDVMMFNSREEVHVMLNKYELF